MISTIVNSVSRKTRAAILKSRACFAYPLPVIPTFCLDFRIAETRMFWNIDSTWKIVRRKLMENLLWQVKVETASLIKIFDGPATVGMIRHRPPKTEKTEKDDNPNLSVLKIEFGVNGRYSRPHVENTNSLQSMFDNDVTREPQH